MTIYEQQTNRTVTNFLAKCPSFLSLKVYTLLALDHVHATRQMGNARPNGTKEFKGGELL